MRFLLQQLMWPGWATDECRAELAVLKEWRTWGASGSVDAPTVGSPPSGFTLKARRFGAPTQPPGCPGARAMEEWRFGSEPRPRSVRVRCRPPRPLSGSQREVSLTAAVTGLLRCSGEPSGERLQYQMRPDFDLIGSSRCERSDAHASSADGCFSRLIW